MRPRTSVWLLALVVCACSGRRLPPGTPPPEYEAPVVAPWAGENGDAAAKPSPEVDAGAAKQPDTALGSELSLDAGPR